MEKHEKEVIVDETDDAIFEKIMSYVGMDGKFQKYFDYTFNLVYVILVAMPCMSIFMILAIPNHWCHFPGRGETNLSLEEWKELTLPRESIANGTFSQCLMYNLTLESVLNSLLREKTNETVTNFETVSCQYGWDFDTTYYTSTAPSQEHWVCDDEINAANVLAVTRIGDIVGTFVMGQLSDIIGRRYVFFISLILLVLGNTISAFTAHYYMVFAGLVSITSFAFTAVFQTPLVLGIELSASDATSKIAMMQCIGWTAGLSIMPFIYWMIGDWKFFLLVVSLPPLLFLFTWRVFPESPRWLVAKGKTSECIKSLAKIAKVNNKSLPPEAILLINKVSNKKETTYGLASLFSSWRLAKNTIILSACWLVNFLVYNVILINISNMSGNPYFNFFWQAVVELPGYILGKYCSENLGRRWTQVGFFFLSAVLHVIIILIIHIPDIQWVISTILILIKLCVCIVGYSSYIMSMEIFPTCVRQTGCSTCALVSSILGAVAPYIVYLGTVTDIQYTYMVMCLVTTTAVVVAFFLPETKGQKLPETLKEAAEFGKGQKGWRIHQESNVVKDKPDALLKEKQ